MHARRREGVDAYARRGALGLLHRVRASRGGFDGGEAPMIDVLSLPSGPWENAMVEGFNVYMLLEKLGARGVGGGGGGFSPDRAAATQRRSTRPAASRQLCRRITTPLMTPRRTSSSGGAGAPWRTCICALRACACAFTWRVATACGCGLMHMRIRHMLMHSTCAYAHSTYAYAFDICIYAHSAARYTRRVEIVDAGGALERFYFPCPVECFHLSTASRDKWEWEVGGHAVRTTCPLYLCGCSGTSRSHSVSFLFCPGTSLWRRGVTVRPCAQVDRSSAQAKLDGLATASDAFIHEMRHLARLARVPLLSFILLQVRGPRVLWKQAARLLRGRACARCSLGSVFACLTS